MTMDFSLPLLLLDVDGVLNPFASPTCPPGCQEFELFADEEPVRLCAAHGDWLQELATRFQLVWATGWGMEANRVLAPRLRLPELPVISFAPVPFHPREKLHAVIDFAADRPVAWIDDAFQPEMREWASQRLVPTLLVDADPAEGLTREAVEQCFCWVDDYQL